MQNEIQNKIKDFICGSDLDLFSTVYLNFKYREKISELAKKKKNSGTIFVVI